MFFLQKYYNKNYGNFKVSKGFIIIRKYFFNLTVNLGYRLNGHLAILAVNLGFVGVLNFTKWAATELQNGKIGKIEKNVCENSENKITILIEF